uniref:Uncharacterized protein n=1 Tax=Medicago truncatula TaxID=3880 RepID=I3SZX9_MEDTR|nr:unknown [Medicago truncatula]
MSLKSPLSQLQDEDLKEFLQIKLGNLQWSWRCLKSHHPFSWVDVRKAAGDTLEYHKFLQEPLFETREHYLETGRD